MPPQNQFTEMESDGSYVSLGQSIFTGVANRIVDVGNEWANISKITNSVNIYPHGTIRPIKDITIEDIDSKPARTLHHPCQDHHPQQKDTLSPNNSF